MSSAYKKELTLVLYLSSRDHFNFYFRSLLSIFGRIYHINADLINIYTYIHLVWIEMGDESNFFSQK